VNSRVADVLAVLDALAAKGVTGPVSIWGVACTLPGQPVKHEPEPGPANREQMLTYFAPDVRVDG
jgi:hypothetical protein